MARFIDPRVDWAFKRIFGSEDLIKRKQMAKNIEHQDKDELVTIVTSSKWMSQNMMTINLQQT